MKVVKTKMYMWIKTSQDASVISIVIPAPTRQLGKPDTKVSCFWDTYRVLMIVLNYGSSHSETGLIDCFKL